MHKSIQETKYTQRRVKGHTVEELFGGDRIMHCCCCCCYRVSLILATHETTITKFCFDLEELDGPSDFTMSKKAMVLSYFAKKYIEKKRIPE